MKPSELILDTAAGAQAIPIIPVAPGSIAKPASLLSRSEKTWCENQGFDGEGGRLLLLPDAAGRLKKVLWGVPSGPRNDGAFVFGRLARQLPAGTYRLNGKLEDASLAALSWALEAYAFEAYRKEKPVEARLVCPPGAVRKHILWQAEAHALARDLINTPASDMGPAELEAAARSLATRHKARMKVTKGRELERSFPMIHAVGKASPREPRLLDLSWGPARAAKLTLVGKGVCFDTGGLDIKPASGMLLMKKDMGGAASVLGLAHMIMSARLPVRLRVLIPAVENAIAGNAFRPGDVLKSRKGLTVEIGNTDAEGRLVLADALALADEEAPDLLIDMATLTGAARVAVGPDLAPFYTRSDDLARELEDLGLLQNDPVWRMPLWDPYLAYMDSRVADINNAGESSFAGSITAALFLSRFVEKAANHMHFDIFGWVPVAKPGRPKGGDAQAIRALFALISKRYAK